LTGPSLSIAALVSGVSGVEARTQTSPVESRTAVERPPKGKIPNRRKGLVHKPPVLVSSEREAAKTHFENVVISGVT
jgi:hypothetical protein